MTRSTREEQEQHLRPRLAVCRSREPDPEPRRLFRLVHGRGIGDPVPRPGRQDPRLPQFVPASRHEGVPLRRGQHRPSSPAPITAGAIGTDGRLVGVPYFREAYHSKLDRVAMGPRRGRAIVQLQGLDLGDLGQRGAVVREYLGDFTRFLDLQLDGWDGREGQAEVLCGIQKWLVPCNWKFPAENFSGDTYHNISHRSVDLAGIGPSRQRPPRHAASADVSRKLHVCIPDRGHQTILYVLPQGQPPPPAYQNAPIVAEYFRHCEEEKRRRRGEEARLVGAPGEIFPNTALLSRQPRTMAVWHPRGPHQTECWRWFFVDRDAPARSRISCATTTSAIPARPA